MQMACCFKYQRSIRDAARSRLGWLHDALARSGPPPMLRVLTARDDGLRRVESEVVL
jgi:hypothetical protein